MRPALSNLVGLVLALAAGLGLSICFVAAGDRGPTGLLASLQGHRESIYDIAYSHDGKYLVTGSGDQTVRVWDAASGKELKTYAGANGHQKMVVGVSVSPDDSLIASAGSDDNTVRVWDFPSSRPVREIALKDGASGLSISGDGNFLAASGLDGRVRAWTSDGKARFDAAGQVGQATDVALSDNGQYLATIGKDQVLRFWSPSDGKAVAALLPHPGEVTGLTINRANNFCYTTGTDGMVKVWPLPPVSSRALPAHTGAVTALALSRDGALVVSGSAEHEVRVGRLTDGQTVRSFTGAKASISSTALSDNGSLVAAGSGDLVLVWQASDGKLIGPMQAHEGGVSGLAFHPTSTRLASGGKDGLIKLWTMPPAGSRPASPPQPVLAKVEGEIKAHEGGVAGVVFHPGGTQLLSAGADGTVKVWDLAKHSAGKTFGPLAGPVSALALNRPGTEVAAASGKSVRVWSVDTGKEKRAFELAESVTALSFSADGNRLAAAGSGGQIRVHDLASGRFVQGFVHGKAIKGLAFHPTNNAVLVSGSDERSVAIDTLTLVREIATGAPVSGLAVGPDSVHILTGDQAAKVKQWAPDGNLERTYDIPSKAVRTLAIAHNNSLLAVAGTDGAVHFFSLPDGKLQKTITTAAPCEYLAFSPNNQLLAVVSSQSGQSAGSLIRTLKVTYNPGQPLSEEFGQTAQSYTDSGQIRQVAFAPSGTLLYSCGPGRPILVWKIAADNPIKSFSHPGLVDCVAFSPDGKQVATGCHDGHVRLFDVGKGQQVRDIAAHTMPTPAPTYCVTWSSDGKQVVSGSLDHSLKIWSAADGKLIQTCKGYEEKSFARGHQEGVFSAVLSPDGKTLASAGYDGSIKLWNVADGSVARELGNPTLKPATAGTTLAHPGPIFRLRFTTDGKRLVSVGKAPGNNGYLALWNVADGQLIHGETMAGSALLCVAVAPDEQSLAVGTARSDRASASEGSVAYILRMMQGK